MGVFFHSPEERWERIVAILFWVAVGFGVLTGYGVYAGDDWRGLVMTLVPGLACLGLWYAARVHLDHKMSESPTPIWVKLIGWMFAGGALATVAWMIIGQATGHLEYVEIKDPNDPATIRENEQEMLRRFSEQTEIVTLPDGTKTLRRKVADAPESVDVDEPAPSR